LIFVSKQSVASIVDAEFKGELFAAWFVFFSLDRKKVKILYWRETGFALWNFRLEQSLFDLGRPRFSADMEVSWRNFGRFLAGYDIFPGTSHKKIPAKRFS